METENKANARASTVDGLITSCNELESQWKRRSERETTENNGASSSVKRFILVARTAEETTRLESRPRS